MKNNNKSSIWRGFLTGSCLAAALLALSSCIIEPPAPPRPTVPMPAVTETTELPWRLYFQDQFRTFEEQATPPPTGVPSVAYSVYFDEKQKFDSRRQMEALQKQVQSLESQNNRLSNQLNKPRITTGSSL